MRQDGVTFRFWIAILLTTLVIFCSVQTCLSQKTTICDTSFRFTEEHLTLPLTVVNEFIFVPAVINGVKGKMMFDTGTREALALNDHLLKRLGAGKVLGQAKVGSGQVYTRTIRDCIRRVQIGDRRVMEASLVESEDLSFIEKDVTPDFIGFVGYDAYLGYAFKLDYVLRRLTLVKGERGSTTSLLKDETVVATLPFTTRRRPDDPFITVTISGRPFIATLDTGQLGVLEMDDTQLDSMIKAGDLQPLAEKDDDGDQLYRVNDLEIVPGVHVSLPGIGVRHIGSIADKGIGITEPAAIYLGYEFLSQFKTIWDWPNQTIYLLRR